MTTINLKDFYAWYTHDEYIEVSDEVAAELKADKLYEAAHQRRTTRNKAQYSLDCDDGIEYSACLHEPTPQELLDRMELFVHLWNALNSLPEVQGIRVEAHLILGKSYRQIAREQGVDKSVVRRSVKRGIGRSAKVAENTALRKQRELDALTARDRELDMLFERLYEDNVAGKIDDARFAKMSKRYEQEQGENAKKIKALRLELKKDESKRMDIDDFLETVRRYTDATTITKRMVAELIDHIEVYHAEKQDGVTNQRVVIYYNCIGAFDVPDRRKIPEADIIMETRKGVALSYAPEQVAV